MDVYLGIENNPNELPYRCLTFHQHFSEELFPLLCGIENCTPGYRFYTKSRPGWHLHVILSGKGVLSVEGRQGELHFGQMFLTKPGEEVWYVADRQDPWSYCWMSFDGNMAGDWMEAAGFRNGVNWLDCHGDPQHFYKLCRRVLDQPELNLANDLIHLGSVLEFIGLAIKSNYQVEQGEQRRREYAPDMYVQYAVDFIDENYASARISDVAGYIGIHRSYLTSIFKKKLGISPQEYLLQCRMKHSNRLLLETDLPVQEISREVGYDNPLTFSKVFKRYFGVSPRRFRSQSAETGQQDES